MRQCNWHWCCFDLEAGWLGYGEFKIAENVLALWWGHSFFHNAFHTLQKLFQQQPSSNMDRCLLLSFVTCDQCIEIDNHYVFSVMGSLYLQLSNGTRFDSCRMIQAFLILFLFQFFAHQDQTISTLFYWWSCSLLPFCQYFTLFFICVLLTVGLLLAKKNFIRWSQISTIMIFHVSNEIIEHTGKSWTSILEKIRKLLDHIITPSFMLPAVCVMVLLIYYLQSVSR